MTQKKTFDAAVYDAIRKTINRFRERPLFYFTEAGLHSSLQSDLLQNSSNILTANTANGFPVSLVHLEYPTNFRYQKSKLIDGYEISLSNYKDHNTYLGKDESYGDRGNYDLAILNSEFAKYDHSHLESKRRIKSNLEKKQQAEALHIINKDNSRAKKRLDDNNYNSEQGNHELPSRFQREVRYAIEFKYIHPHNARYKSMLDEIIKDNEKLKLAYYHSHGFIRPVNLVFCSSVGLKRRDGELPIVDRIITYIKGENKEHPIPDHVLNIFIHSFIRMNKKETPKPIAFCSKPGEWARDLCNVLKINFLT